MLRIVLSNLFLIAVYSSNSFAQLPKIEKGAPLSFLSYGANLRGSQANESHNFYSDGTYCQTFGGGGAFAVFGGKWFYKTPTLIETTINPLSQNYFAYWDLDQDSSIRSYVYLTQFLTNDKEKLIIGFGDNEPTNIGWYYTKMADTNLLIPPNAQALFVGDGSSDIYGNYILRRFPLFPKPNVESYNFKYVVSKDFNSAKEIPIKDDFFSYQLINSQLIFKGLGNSKPLETINSKKIELNPKDDDYIYEKQQYEYCRTGKGVVMFEPTLVSKEPILPTEIKWKGIIKNNVNWSKISQ